MTSAGGFVKVPPWRATSSPLSTDREGAQPPITTILRGSRADSHRILDAASPRVSKWYWTYPSRPRFGGTTTVRRLDRVTGGLGGGTRLGAGSGTRPSARAFTNAQPNGSPAARRRARLARRASAAAPPWEGSVAFVRRAATVALPTQRLEQYRLRLSLVTNWDPQCGHLRGKV